MTSSGNEEEPQKKVQRTSDRIDDEEVHENEEEVNPGPFNLGNGSRKKVSVAEFMGKTRIDIREYYEKNGEELPGKKGISLSLEEWNVLINLSPDIDRATKKIEKNTGRAKKQRRD